MPATSAPFIDQLALSTTAARYNGATSLPIPRGITIKALAANTTKCYIGLSTVTSSNGFELAAGEAVHIPATYAADLNLLYFRSDSGTPGVCLLAP